MEFYRISIEDVINTLPDICEVDFITTFANKEYDLYIQSVGFEQRTVGVLERLSKIKGLNINESLLEAVSKTPPHKN